MIKPVCSKRIYYNHKKSVYHLFYILIFYTVLFSCNRSFTEVVVDQSGKAVIIKGSNASEQELNIIRLLQQKIRDKTGIMVPIVDEGQFEITNSGYSAIIIPGTPTSNHLLKEVMETVGTGFPDKQEGFHLRTTKYRSLNFAIIAGADVLGVLYGSGKLLRESDYADRCMQTGPLNITEYPMDNSRGIYPCMHTNNWYEDIPDINKVDALIKEQGLWGANMIWLWFDMPMYQYGPFDKDSDSSEKWARIKQMAKAATDIGMSVGFIESLNSAYLGQVNDEIRAVKGNPPEGLLCPRAHAGESMKIMDDNYRELYGDLRNAGISADAFSLFFYDRGGCSCKLCLPWVETGVRYVGEQHAKTIKEYFPESKIYLADWHFGVRNGIDEVLRVKDYLKTSDAVWISGIQKDDRHSWNRWSGIGDQYEVTAFLDITMIGGWSGFGANPFPARLDSMFNGMKSNWITGGLAYSEGIFDDINKILFLQHQWGGYQSEKILKEYTRWYFDVNSTQQNKISDILFDMESEWTDIYASWGRCQPLKVQPELNLKSRVDSIEQSLPIEVKDLWRWKLIHSRANLAWLAVEISGLKGSGYDQFVSYLKSMSAADAKTAAREKIIWLEKKIELFDAEYDQLYHSIYEGTKSGMYGAVPPDPGRWINGFNRGEKWKALLEAY